jgi:hypothetical protein
VWSAYGATARDRAPGVKQGGQAAVVRRTPSVGAPIGAMRGIRHGRTQAVHMRRAKDGYSTVALVTTQGMFGCRSRGPLATW